MDKTKYFFNLEDAAAGVPRRLAPGVEARIFAGEKAMLSLVRLAPHARSALHAHPQEQWGLMLEGSGLRIQDGAEIPVGAGDFWRTPGGVEHALKAGPDGARVLDIFAPPRDEYRSPD